MATHVPEWRLHADFDSLKAKEDATELLEQKQELEKEKKAIVQSATEKETLLQSKIKSIGNLVHDSVPVSDNEVQRTFRIHFLPLAKLREPRTITQFSGLGRLRV